MLHYVQMTREKMTSQTWTTCGLLGFIWFFGSSTAQSSASSPSPSPISKDDAQTMCNLKTFNPIAVPIENVTLSQDAQTKGVRLSVGSPPQTFALSVDTKSNITFLLDPRVNSCSSSVTQAACESTRGGSFDVNKSSTWYQYGNYTSVGWLEPTDLHVNDFFGTDLVHFSDNLTTQMPFGVCQQGSEQCNTIGLGSESGWLSELVRRLVIPAKSWALFTGWSGGQAQYQKDGNLVLGGYDQAKIKPNGHTITLPLDNSGACPGGLLLSIDDVQMALRNGSADSIQRQYAEPTFQACIDPTFPGIMLTNNIFDHFVRLSGSDIQQDYNNSSQWLQDMFNMVIKDDNVYTGDLMMFIHSNFTLRITNDELVVPITSIDPNGHRSLRNSTYSQLMVSGAAQNSMPILGTAFLTNAYLYVDYDRSELTLWEGSHSMAQDLVATKPYNCLASDTDGSTENGGLSGGAKAGIIVGSVVGAALSLGIAVLFLFRRRRRQRNRRRNPALETMRGSGKSSSSDGQTPDVSKAELHSSERKGPQELSPDYGSEMPSEGYMTHEMPSDNHPHSTAQPAEMSDARRAS